MSEYGQQGVTLNTLTFPELTDLVEKTFVSRQNMPERKALQVFIKESIGKGAGDTKKFQEVDTSTYARNKAQGANSKKASFGIGYSKIMTKKRVALEIDITQEMLDENKYSEVGALMKNLGDFCPNRIDLDATHRLTFGDAVSYTDMDGDTVDLTTGDGLQLFHSAHTLVFSTKTYSSRITGDPVFSKQALQMAEKIYVSNIFSNFGEKRTMKANTIISGDDPETVDNISMYLKSSSDPTQANSGVLNVQQNKYTHLILPNLATDAIGAPDSTKRRWWMLAKIGAGYEGLQAVYGEWEPSHLKPQSDAQEDYSADIMTYGTRAGYGFAVISARGIVASLPTN